ncbi:hypothetical protein KP509_27G061000 [Ceratopteris richardii]|uniref:Pentatricopeptide repeat-containing protein n=1 Tax=Ceratopteris richardii TaxID=49495 RepID=A0A8T2RJH4_CERRI|nr:hypothetical protein KP509_27G061000 [Ceratopteris richardii]
MRMERVEPDTITFVCCLRGCSSMRAIEKGQEMHVEVERLGLLDRDLIIGNVLLDMYVECGLHGFAKQIFYKLPIRDVASWTTLIAGYIDCEYNQNAIDLFEIMQSEGPSPDSTTYICRLKACGSMKNMERGQEVHKEIERHLMDIDASIGNSLVEIYSKCGDIHNAKEVFEKLPEKDIVSWNTIATGYAENGFGAEVLALLQRMRMERVEPDTITFVCCLRGCSSMRAIEKGQEMHAEVERLGLLDRDLVIGNVLLDMYVECGLHGFAKQIFYKLPIRDVASWTTLIAGYIDCEYNQNAIDLFEIMQSEGPSPDSTTYICRLKACGSMKNMERGQEVHIEIERHLMDIDASIGNSLVEMYSKCGYFTDAKEVFEKLPEKDIVSWNTIATGYAENGFGAKVLALLQRMRMERVEPDTITFVCCLRGCSSMRAIEKGQEMHAEVERLGLLDRDLVIGNVLLDMYVECGLHGFAKQIFYKLPIRDVASWTTLIAGYIDCEYNQNAIDLFEIMQSEGPSPDSTTYICRLKACGSMKNMERGQEVHIEIELHLMDIDASIGNSLVEMYSKCGYFTLAWEVFDRLDVRDDST